MEFYLHQLSPSLGSVPNAEGSWLIIIITLPLHYATRLSHTCLYAAQGRDTAGGDEDNGREDESNMNSKAVLSQVGKELESTLHLAT